MVIAELLSDAITGIILALGYPGIFLLMAGESAALPVPSEVVLPFAGYGVFLGNFDLVLVILVATIGQWVGAMAAYYGARLGGRPFVERYGKYAMIDGGHLKMTEEWFKKHGTKAVFASRLLPIVRTFIPLPAGLAKMDAKKYALYTFAGSLPWTAALVYAGYWLGPYWKDIFKFFGGLDILVLIAIVITLVYFVRKRR